MKGEKNMNSYSKILEAVRTWKTSEAIKMLEDNIREQEANKNYSKGSNEKKQFSIITSLLKEIDKNYNHNFRFLKAQKQENGDYIFTDGHRAFINPSCLGYEVAEKQEAYNFNTMLKELNSYTKTLVIDKNQLKTYIAIRGYRKSTRNMKPFLVQTGNGEIIGFNPFHALECMDYSGNNVFYYTNSKSPLYALNHSCLFLPVYVRDSIDYESWYKEIFGEQELEKAI